MQNQGHRRNTQNTNEYDDDRHNERGNNDGGARANIRNSVGSFNVIGSIEDLRLSNTTKSFSFKDVEESFEYFTGEDHQNITSWLEEFEEQAIILGWKDLEKLVYGRRLMKGEAKQFVSYELKPRTWNGLKYGLQTEYSIEVNSQLIHRKLEATTKKSEETYREYCYRMMNIAAPAKIDEASLINYIVDGIPESKNNKMFLRNYAFMKQYSQERIHQRRRKRKMVFVPKTNAMHAIIVAMQNMNRKTVQIRTRD